MSSYKTIFMEVVSITKKIIRLIEFSLYLAIITVGIHLVKFIIVPYWFDVKFYATHDQSLKH